MLKGIPKITITSINNEKIKFIIDAALKKNGCRKFNKIPKQRLLYFSIIWANIWFQTTMQNAFSIKFITFPFIFNILMDLNSIVNVLPAITNKKIYSKLSPHILIDKGLISFVLNEAAKLLL